MGQGCKARAWMPLCVLLELAVHRDSCRLLSGEEPVPASPVFHLFLHHRDPGLLTSPSRASSHYLFPTWLLPHNCFKVSTTPTELPTTLPQALSEQPSIPIARTQPGRPQPLDGPGPWTAPARAVQAVLLLSKHGART